MKSAPCNMPLGMYKGQSVDSVPTRYLMWWATLPIVPKLHPEVFTEAMRVMHERTSKPDEVLKEFIDSIAEKCR